MEDIRSRKVEKRPDRIRFDGRVLYLAEDPALVRRQVAGEDLDWTPDIKLRDDISTDEITPAFICYYYDETLGEFPYLGLKCGGELPIGRGDVKRGGFAVSVAGKRRGKGSSREQSPYAEQMAGIRLVVAESIERIYLANCQNLGILTSTDFSILAAVRRKEEIPLDAFTAGEDGITRQIVSYGGLFPFNVARLQGKVSIPAVTTGKRPMTLAEKIFARHFIADSASGRTGVPAVQPGDAGFVATDIRFSHEYVTPMAAIFFEKELGPDAHVTDPGSICFFRDHLTFLDDVMPEERKKQGLLDVAHDLERKQREFASKQGIRLHGELAPAGAKTGSEAICHSKILETYAEPGQVIIGSDSHTPHAGAIGAVAFGVGTTDLFNAWITRDVRVRVPGSVLAKIKGKKRPWVTAKDFMLMILAHPYVKSGKAIGKVIEYAGEAVQALSIDERATMTNMAAEVGAFTGVVAPDAKTAEFLAERGMPRGQAQRLCEGLFTDAGARHEQVIEIDAGILDSMVALPGDPGNGIPIRDLARTKIEIAYGGSCTAGKKEDMDMYARVLKEAVAAGRRVPEGVEFWLQFGSQDVKKYCEEKGYLRIFERAGARVLEPSCGACINAGPGVSTRPDQVTVSAINRNFPGRSGPGQMYLASPYVVAASAIAGEIAPYRPAGM